VQQQLDAWRDAGGLHGVIEQDRQALLHEVQLHSAVAALLSKQKSQRAPRYGTLPAVSLFPACSLPQRAVLVGANHAQTALEFGEQAVQFEELPLEKELCVASNSEASGEAPPAVELERALIEHVRLLKTLCMCAA
jgi:hypothetical protein